MHSARRHSNRRTAGTTLLEALGALGVTGVGVLGLVTSTVFLTRANRSSGSVAAATALAQQKLEQLRSMPLNATQLDPGIYYDAGNKLKADGTSGGTFDRSWLVSVKDTPRPGLKTVTVTVAWTDSRSHSTQVASYVRCNAVPCQ